MSQSFHRPIEARSGDVQADDIYKDWLALHEPYPTIVQAAGNYVTGDDDGIDPIQDEFVNHKTFNCLVVGNHDDTATTMDGSSVFRNPRSSPGHDRELPDISANGTAVTAVGLTMSGTSMATPAVAGSVALLQQAVPILQSWPEGCRALVLAGSNRLPSTPDWFTDVQNSADRTQGAGALDAMESLNIARYRVSPGNQASRVGWDIATLHDGDLGSDGTATFSYNVLAPELLYRPSVKVALAWDSTVSTLPGNTRTPTSSELIHDLDLNVYNSAGSPVAQSSSWDNSYEIVEFACRPSERFNIRIRRVRGDGDVWFGLAWSVRTRLVLVG